MAMVMAACGNSDNDAQDHPDSPTHVPSPTLTAIPITTPNPENITLLNTFSHISGAMTIRYPSNWLVATDGNEVTGSVEIGNTRSAQIGNPTRHDELSIKLIWSPASELVSATIPQDIGPLPLLSAIVDEWHDNIDSTAHFSEPFAIDVAGYQGARADGETANANGNRLNTTLVIVDFGEGVAGYFIVKTPGELDEFEPLVTRMIESAHYGGPPAIVVIPPEDWIQPLYEVGHLQAVRGVLTTQDGTRFITWSNDASVVGYDLQDGHMLQSFALPTRITTVTLNSGEDQILIQPEGEPLSLWSLDTGDLLLTFQANTANSPLQGFSWSPDNTFLLGWAINYSSGASLVPIWDMSNADSTRDPFLPFETHRPSLNAQVTSGLWNHASTQFIIVDSSTRAHVFMATGDESFFTPTHSDKIFGAAWRSDDEQLMTWSQDKLVLIWDVTTGTLLQSLRHERPVRGAVWRSDDREILSWQVDNKAFVWEADTGRQRFELDIGSASGGAVWSPSSDYIVTWSHELVRVPRVRLWDAETGIMRFELVGENILGAEAFSPDEHQLVSWSTDGIISVWNMDTGEWDFIMRHDGVEGVRWTPDGTRLVSWSTDGTIRVWDSHPDVDFTDIRQH